MIELIPFKAGHALNLDVRDVTLEAGRFLKSELHMRSAETYGFGITAIDEGKVLGCLIIIPMPWKGVAEACVLLSGRIERHKLWLHRIFKKSVGAFQEEHEWHRLQCVAVAGSNRNNAWLKSLGFEPESVLEAYGPDREDYIQWVRIRR